ncbi:hypothetical protein PSFL_03930 [Pseudomonas sp. DD1]|uniref:abortive infection system antitoxin AbiGi family protein n=1 Tax=Pseudomonas sp. DD1 TaxID=879558 RepID=UPI0037C98271
MQPRSSTLFHFTKNNEILKSLLKNGFWPRYCLEDIAWQNEEFDFVAFPMVCFCDIPISRINEHVAFYGSFGVGLTREWGLKNGLNPVCYMAKSETFETSLNHVLDLAHEHEDDDTRLESLNHARYVLSYFKPIHGRMIIGGESINKEFYQESEWRYVPRHENLDHYLLESDFNNKKKLDKANKTSLDYCLLKFLPSDIRYIFVPTDADIPNIINFIQTELDNYPSSELKVLLSRVTSLESIAVDL